MEMCQKQLCMPPHKDWLEEDDDTYRSSKVEMRCPSFDEPTNDAHIVMCHKFCASKNNSRGYEGKF